MKKYKIESGTKFHWSDRKLYHIVLIFTDAGEESIVMKTYDNYRKYWIYKVVSMDLMKWWFSSKCFKEVNK